VGNLNTVKLNQRRFAPTPAHITGIKCPLHWNTQMGAELGKVGAEFAHAESPASVAVVLSYDSLWALQIGDHNFPYFDELRVFSNSFRRWGLNTDIVEPTGDRGKYKVVAAPSLHVVDPATASNLEKFVSNGGVLILSARSGFKNPDNLATDLPPGPLQHLAKVRVKDFTQLSAPERSGAVTDQGAYQPNSENRIRSTSPDWAAEYRAMGWIDILESDGAQTLFQYQLDYYASRPAVTIADYGTGKVVYVGTILEPCFYVDLAKQVCAWAHLEPISEIPEGMDFAIRQKNGRSIGFLLNFAESPQSVRLRGEHRDLLSGKVFAA
jgi:beta-galactosidase